MEYDDKYDEDESFQEDYEDFDSAADDWEEEAQQIEEQARAEQKAREVLQERKIANRAFKRAEKIKEVEEIQPEDVQKEANILQEDASNTASAANAFEESHQYIADMPFRTVEDAEILGEAIANHIMKQSGKKSFEAMLEKLYMSLSKDFSLVDDISTVLNTHRFLLDKLKREEKLEKRRGGQESRTKEIKGDIMEVSDGQWKGEAADSNDDEQPF